METYQLGLIIGFFIGVAFGSSISNILAWKKEKQDIERKLDRKIENPIPASIAWTATIIMLFSYMSYNVFTTGNFGIIGIIFFASMTVYWASYLVHRKKK